MGPDIYKYSRLFSFPDISKWARQHLFHTINPGARTASRGASRSPPGPRLGVGRGGGGAPAPGRQVPAEPQAWQGAGPSTHTRTGHQPGMQAAPGGFGDGRKPKISPAVWRTRAVQKPASQLTHPASFLSFLVIMLQILQSLFVCFLSFSWKKWFMLFFFHKGKHDKPVVTVTESRPGSPVFQVPTLEAVGEVGSPASRVGGVVSEP